MHDGHVDSLQTKPLLAAIICDLKHGRHFLYNSWLKNQFKYVIRFSRLKISDIALYYCRH